MASGSKNGEWSIFYCQCVLIFSHFFSLLWLGMVGIDGRGGFYRCQLARLCAHALNRGQIVQFDHSDNQHRNQYRDDHHNDHKQSSSPSTSFSLCAHFCWEHLPPSEYWVPSGCTGLTSDYNLFFIFSVQWSQNQIIFREILHGHSLPWNVQPPLVQEPPHPREYPLGLYDARHT